MFVIGYSNWHDMDVDDAAELDTLERVFFGKYSFMPREVSRAHFVCIKNKEMGLDACSH